MLREAGFSANDLATASEDAGVRMALFNGIMQETETQVGNAAKYADEFAGTQVRLSTASDHLAKSVGDAVAPALDALMKVLIPIIEGVASWVEKHPTLTTVLVTFGGIITGVTSGLAGMSVAMMTVATGMGMLEGAFVPFLIGGAVIAGILGVVGAL
jgi:phage-related tail protein